MGLCLDKNDIPELGSVEVELRRRSFRLYDEHGSAEFEPGQIPHLRAALDAERSISPTPGAR